MTGSHSLKGAKIMGTIKDATAYLAKQHEKNKAARAERREEERLRREEERLRREEERKLMLAQLSERLQRQLGWEMLVVDRGIDDWNDPVYLLNDGTYITVSDRNPLSYRKKPTEDPFKNVRYEWDLERIKDQVLSEVRRETRPAQNPNNTHE